jgi:hypothetical protein
MSFIRTSKGQFKIYDNEVLDENGDGVVLAESCKSDIRGRTPDAGDPGRIHHILGMMVVTAFGKWCQQQIDEAE